ncbi:MAG: GNAT family N-acetyltransferase [Prevotella sp.]|nr:GNAT family N-acetyltransferase [Prevotella sp.]
MNIRKATDADLSVVLSLRDKAREIMRHSGNPDQWPIGYPKESVFAKDINEGNCYIIEDEDGASVATFSFIPGQDITYQTIKGEWLDDELPYYTIHRIASNGACSGIFQTIIDFCSSRTNNIRIDTHRDNAIMRHLLSHTGFSYCGIIWLANGEERLAFQKLF